MPKFMKGYVRTSSTRSGNFLAATPLSLGSFIAFSSKIDLFPVFIHKLAIEKTNNQNLMTSLNTMVDLAKNVSQ